ncbi:hypothetical protein PoB_001762300 [Plakobranchus ocellatus]|uniref:Uncharacterized protein n=1 Tax=Plakobranchus ocellatus TaxID=259542 RepID=A0AAV3Z9J4_9GAST|nr:hypothetical protein PoB_001762300 [Plakobranchus ocellatus]
MDIPLLIYLSVKVHVESRKIERIRRYIGFFGDGHMLRPCSDYPITVSKQLHPEISASWRCHPNKYDEKALHRRSCGQHRPQQLFLTL